ncbi:hypothetical protein MAR_017085, partial [Mya arenaria]
MKHEAEWGRGGWSSYYNVGVEGMPYVRGVGVAGCSKCKKCMHSDCVNIAEAELPSWSTKHARFFCPKCVFSGDEYNAGSALL